MPFQYPEITKAPGNCLTGALVINLTILPIEASWLTGDTPSQKHSVIMAPYACLIKSPSSANASDVSEILNLGQPEQTNRMPSQLLQRRYGVYKKSAKHEFTSNFSDNDVSMLRGNHAIDGQN